MSSTVAAAGSTKTPSKAKATSKASSKAADATKASEPATLAPVPDAAAPSQPAAPRRTLSSRAARKTGTAKSFTPAAKHPVLEVELRLSTEPATMVYERTYVPAQTSLYYLSVVYPIRSRQQSEGLDQVNEIIEARFEKLEGELEDELKRLQTMMRNEGASMPDAYTFNGRVGNSPAIKVQIYTPQMNRFLGLIRNFDQVMQHIDALWFAGKISDKHRSQHIITVRNRLTRFTRELYNLNMRARGAIDRELAGRQTGPASGAGEPATAPKASVAGDAEDDALDDLDPTAAEGVPALVEKVAETA